MENLSSIISQFKDKEGSDQKSLLELNVLQILDFCQSYDDLGQQFYALIKVLVCKLQLVTASLNYLKMAIFSVLPQLKMFNFNSKAILEGDLQIYIQNYKNAPLFSLEKFKSFFNNADPLRLYFYNSLISAIAKLIETVNAFVHNSEPQDMKIIYDTMKALEEAHGLVFRNGYLVKRCDLSDDELKELIKETKKGSLGDLGNIVNELKNFK
jgi:hypothetical protein